MDSTNSTSVIEENPCSPSQEQINEAYNLKLHIIAVFVLLIISFLGAALSVLSTHVKHFRLHPIIINSGKFFGSGVILSTAFIHILPDAMETLTDSCLPDSWNVYGAYSGLFAMLAILGMQFIEFLAHQRYRSTRQKHNHLPAHINGKQYIQDEKMSSRGEEVIKRNQKTNSIHDSADIVITSSEIEGSMKEQPMKNEIDGFPHIHQGFERANEIVNDNQNIAPIIKYVEENRTGGESIEADSHTEVRLEGMEQTNESTEKRKKKSLDKNLNNVENIPEIHDHIGDDHFPNVEILNMESSRDSGDLCNESNHYHGAAFQDNGQGHKISTYLLELGIALHSILIGITLGTTTESFVALFVALAFHQFFEAIALGAQIANLKTTSLKPAISMVIFFSLTTPVGIAIGIGIHSGTYNPKSIASLITTGILDSLAAGVLIYVALVNLITAEMGANAHGFYSLRTRLKLLYFIALYLGVAAMAIIGRWA